MLRSIIPPIIAKIAQPGILDLTPWLTPPRPGIGGGPPRGALTGSH